MRIISLPGTTLRVSRICLGTADLGTPKINEADSHALLDAFVEKGGNFLDTARVYSDWVPGEMGRSERVIGDWLAKRPGMRDRIVIATKGAHPRLSSMVVPRMSRRDIVEDVELSLRALRTDRIDLWYLHRDAPQVPVSEILGVLNELIAQGKLRYIACSNWQPPRIREAFTVAQRQGLKGFVANQMLWNVGCRHMRPPGDKTLHVFNEQTFQLHRAYPMMAAVAYSSQANGFFEKLASSDAAEVAKAQKSEYHTPGNLRVFEEVRRLAAGMNASISAIVLSYLLSQPIQAIPVVGTYTRERMEIAFSALNHPLQPTQLARLEQAIRSA